MGKDRLRRKPAVAGFFYPARGDSLRNLIGTMVSEPDDRIEAISVVSPHAGFQYSGFVAGAVYSAVEIPPNIIILGPSHRYGASSFALMRRGVWETPLGEVPLNSALADRLMEAFPRFTDDRETHISEHSLEVQLPFLQYFRADITLVPICIATHASFDQLKEMGEAISSAVREYNEDILIVASTDMSHYISQEEAGKKDFMAIEKILRLDARGLYETVIAEDISMCGFQAAVAALVASKELGAGKAELIKYQTSGDISGDYSEVVGYAGLRVS
jgi:AmmeMemoRadiSam system protein B